MAHNNWMDKLPPIKFLDYVSLIIHHGLNENNSLKVIIAGRVENLDGKAERGHLCGAWSIQRSEF